jgi:hypothetical protein
MWEGEEEERGECEEQRCVSCLGSGRKGAPMIPCVP